VEVRREKRKKRKDLKKLEVRNGKYEVKRNLKLEVGSTKRKKKIEERLKKLEVGSTK